MLLGVCHKDNCKKLGETVVSHDALPTATGYFIESHATSQVTLQLAMRLCSRVATFVCGRFQSHAMTKSKRVITNRHGNARCYYASASLGDETQLVFLLPSEEATYDLAATFCASRRKGDAYLIHGNLGAGKSAFW